MIVSATIVIIAVAIVLIVRRVDVRLVLITAGVLLAALVGRPTMILDVFQRIVGRGDIIGPICTAMGYAFVLRLTGCDTDMVRLLVRPLRHVAWALVPGGVMIGFFTNMAITSQTAAAAAVGPILVPLMIAAGHRPVTAGATVLVGCSIGGNLFNPGEPDIVAVKGATGLPVADVINAAVTPTLLAVAVAIIVLMVVVRRQGSLQRAVTGVDDAGREALTVRSVLRAMLAPLPVVLLFLLQPRFHLVPMVHTMWPDGIAVSAIMLICTALVIVTTARSLGDLRDHASRITVEFFTGMGYAFTNVISLIIAASCFLAGMEAVGLITTFTTFLMSSPELAATLSPVLTWALAMMSGSGTAPSVSFSQAVLPPLVHAGYVSLAVSLGVAGAIGASIGRTMSPASAVMHFSSTIAEVQPMDLIRIVWLPLIAALVSCIAYGLVFS